MLAPSKNFSNFQNADAMRVVIGVEETADHKCEGPRLISEAPHTAPKGESSSGRTPKARSTSNKSGGADHPVGSQEYPVWQAVLITRQG